MEWAEGEAVDAGQDPTARSSDDTPDPMAPSPFASTEGIQGGASWHSDPTAASSESSSDSTPQTSPSESETSSDEPTHSGDLLAGTSSEQAPGVGGTGDHPAPAAMRDPETGELHQAGRPPAGNVASETSPVGDSSDETDAEHALSPEARAELEAEHEPEQVEIDRPDIGTP